MVYLDDKRWETEDVFMLDLESAKTVALTEDTLDQSDPAISGSTVVYGERGDVYLVKLP
jgi:hypothetical protein